LLSQLAERLFRLNYGKVLTLAGKPRDILTLLDLKIGFIALATLLLKA
jgi:hypothetical protein